jgi:hypothetical protein
MKGQTLEHRSCQVCGKLRREWANVEVRGYDRAFSLCSAECLAR